jgi:nucleoside-diphosphate-sugar epimerase
VPPVSAVQGRKILIVGGAGFLGTHMAERLCAANQVSLLDVQLEGALRFSPLAKNDRVRRIAADVLDPDAVEKEVATTDMVLHFASLMGVRHVIDNSRKTLETILLGTRNVLEAVARHRDRIQRLMYLSTSEVYGDTAFADEHSNSSVSCGNDARTSYASAKLAAEHWVWAYQREYSIPTVIVRPFNVYGPYRSTSHAVGHFVVKALHNTPLEIHGDGSQVRSWCYVDDCCAAMQACLERQEAVGKHFNIGNPTATVSVYELAHRIRALCGSSSPIATAQHTFSDIGVRSPQPELARRLLDFSPSHDLTGGLLKTIAWHKEHLADFAAWK